MDSRDGELCFKIIDIILPSGGPRIFLTHQLVLIDTESIHRRNRY